MERTTAHETRIRIQIQYIETPRLRLSQAQLVRLCGVSDQVCSEALATLLWSGFLKQAADGAFVRSGMGASEDRACGEPRSDAQHRVAAF